MSGRRPLPTQRVAGWRAVAIGQAFVPESLNGAGACLCPVLASRY